jgi:hypothetical protein
MSLSEAERTSMAERGSGGTESKGEVLKFLMKLRNK